MFRGLLVALLLQPAGGTLGLSTRDGQGTFAPPSGAADASPEQTSTEGDAGANGGGTGGANPASDEAPAPDLSPEVVDSPDEAGGASDTATQPIGGGVAGSLIDPDDPNAQRAKSDLEGETLDPDRGGAPERLPPLQRAGWWTFFGTVTLASAGGVMAGLVERQEQEATRLAVDVDLTTGGRANYESVSENYQDMLRRGRQYQGAARGLFIASAVTAVASITLFAVDAKRRRARREQARLRLGAGSMEVSF